MRQLRNKLNEQNNAKLACKRNELSTKKNEMAFLDQRIEEMQVDSNFLLLEVIKTIYRIFFLRLGKIKEEETSSESEDERE